MSVPLRLGIVPYLNVLPLLEGLDARFPARDWVRATPRELAAMLADARIDVATLPIFEALRFEGCRILPGCAIACDGPVRSVVFDALRPPNAWQRVLLDRSSLTSIHLAQLLCREHLRIAPQFELSDAPLKADFDLAASRFDAAVVIGDTALALEGRHPVRLDLGALWKEWTGLPFVFAAWVARSGADVTDADIDAFAAARDRGGAAIADIVRRETNADHPLSIAERERYLRESIRYRLGEPEWRAIETFRAKLLAAGLLPQPSAAGKGGAA